MQLKFSQLREDNAEVKSEKESLNKILNDVKKKRQSEKEKNNEELEELKSQHEVSISSIYIFKNNKHCYMKRRLNTHKEHQINFGDYKK